MKSTMPLAFLDEASPVDLPTSPTTAMPGGEDEGGEIEESVPVVGADTKDLKPVLGFLPPPEKRKTALRVRRTRKGRKEAFKVAGADG